MVEDYLEVIIIIITTIIARVITIMVVEYLEAITTTIIITIIAIIARVIIIMVGDYLEAITTIIITATIARVTIIMVAITTTPETVYLEAITTIVQVIIITVGVDYLITAPIPRIRMPLTMFLQTRMVMFFKKTIRVVLASEIIRPIAGTNHNRLI
jgi:hypothetical protein